MNGSKIRDHYGAKWLTFILANTNISLETHLNEIEGIVLIDEIDKHLHIKLQKEVLPSLMKLFPRVQFIVSSHSPFLNMGLYAVNDDRAIIVDLDNFGIRKNPTTTQMYEEVYSLMITENEQFKILYDSLRKTVSETKRIRIVSEGHNYRHMEHAIAVLRPELLEAIEFVKGVEDKTGTQQLKNAYEVMYGIDNGIKTLFIWDCDYESKVKSLVESEQLFKYVLEYNEENRIADIGIENSYPESIFDESGYDYIVKKTGYGGENKCKVFNKNKFFEKIESLSDIEVFQKFLPLCDKISEIIADASVNDFT